MFNKSVFQHDLLCRVPQLFPPSCTGSIIAVRQYLLDLAHKLSLGNGDESMYFILGLYPFFRNKFSGLFQDFSRTQIDFSRALKYTLTLHFQDLNVSSPYSLPYISYFLVEFNRFPGFSRNSGHFPVLENARIKFQDFPGFPGPV